jgi:hypothetical protein
VYDCGCADDEDEESGKGGKKREEKEEVREKVREVKVNAQSERRDPATGLELVGG